MARTQAKRGGEIGVNGEQYEGGQFLPSSPDTEKGKHKIKSGGKVELEPYVWAKREQPDTLSIYDRIKTFCRDNRRECEFVKGKGLVGLKLTPVDSEIDLSVTTHGVPGQRYIGNGQYETAMRPMANREHFEWLQRMAERFNNGERWINLSEDPYHYLNIPKPEAK